VVIIPDCGEPLTVGKTVDATLKRLSERFEVNGHRLFIGASAGITIAPIDGIIVEDLIANADLALYDAKAAGGRTYRFFVPALRAKAQARRELDMELRRAFADNEFVLHFQPQVRVSDGAVVGAEALLRWQHPIRGILGPAGFIEALAESPVALEAGRWILQTACSSAAAWRSQGLSIRIGVNLFPAQFHEGTLLEDVETALFRS
jgi:predicted signal transduction protein with EAL and GGDEF domain